MLGRGNPSTQRKLAPVQLCPPQIPHGMTLVRTRPPLWEAREPELLHDKLTFLFVYLLPLYCNLRVNDVSMARIPH
jgi:hypothetical protein